MALAETVAVMVLEPELDGVEEEDFVFDFVTVAVRVPVREPVRVRVLEGVTCRTKKSF